MRNFLQYSLRQRSYLWSNEFLESLDQLHHKVKLTAYHHVYLKTRREMPSLSASVKDFIPVHTEVFKEMHVVMQKGD